MTENTKRAETNSEDETSEQKPIEISFTGDVAVGIMQDGNRNRVRFVGIVDGVETEVCVDLEASSLRAIAKDMVRIALGG